MARYDYLIVGAGLFGSVFAYLAAKSGRRVLVCEKRNHIGGNCATEQKDDYVLHLYGPHIFHTSDKNIWNFINSISPMKRFTNQPMANYKGELYNLPFNLNTFCKIYNETDPNAIAKKLEASRVNYSNPQNLEQYCLSVVGANVYEKLIKGYTEKQWGRKCEDLPADFVKRIPIRMVFDNQYFDDEFQGMPKYGYSHLFNKLLEGVDVIVNCDFFENQEALSSVADRILYTGPIDRYFEYSHGRLEWRYVRFTHEDIEMSNVQGCAVMNFTDAETLYTRRIEHKHFCNSSSKTSVVSYEYPSDGTCGGDVLAYPIPTPNNMALYARYQALSEKCNKTIFGGRLAEYQYLNMDKVVEKAIALWKKESKSYQ